MCAITETIYAMNVCHPAPTYGTSRKSLTHRFPGEDLTYHGLTNDW